LSIPLWQPAYVGLGSNLDDPAAHVRRALDELARIADTRLGAHSRLYRTPPLGPPDQPDYVNAVAALLTLHGPEALLELLNGIEKRHGRDRAGPKWGPRTLDLDLLVYGDRELSTERLVLPHPGAHERCFVLVPLAEIAPDVRIPGHGRVAKLAQACDAGSITPLE
jgi:2-amino-4-hydroxy-6-hydroxymethyldihydropteridine diphosphokinase